MNKSDEDTAVVDVANVEWGVYKMHHLITDLTTSQCEKKKDHPREEAFQLWSFQLFIQIRQKSVHQILDYTVQSELCHIASLHQPHKVSLTI